MSKQGIGVLLGGGFGLRVETGVSMGRVFSVLIADDEPHIRAIVGSKLRTAGLTVIEARDGREAMELAVLRKPDAIVTDLQMPHLSGMELALALRRNAATSIVPILMLTARGHIVPSTELAQTNIRELLAKPFSAKTLLEKVLVMLNEPGSASGASAGSGSLAA